MIRLIIGILIFVSGFYFGYLFKRIYAHRCKFWEEIILFLNYSQSKLEFFHSHINEIIQDYKAEYPKTLLSNALINVKVPDKCTKTDIYGKFLSDDLKSFLIDYFNGIYKLDSISQKGYINYNISLAEEYKKKSVFELNSKGSMYFKLSPIIGLAILIIIV